MYPESENLSDYLVSDTIVDWQTPAIRQKVIELTETLADEVAKARSLYEWVRDAVPHSNDADLDILTCTASEVLHHGTGICFAKSHLLAALLRAVNIPAGFCYQLLRLNPPVDNMLVLHGFNAIYLATLQRWVRLDARGNTNGINAQFSVEKEQLAFATDPLAGELMYEAIFAAPVSSVVNRLQRYKTRSELWLDLPQSLTSREDAFSEGFEFFPAPIAALPKADVPIEGITAYLSQSDSHQIVFMHFEKDVRLPEHSHAAQVGFVLDGKIELTVDEVTTVYTKGDRYHIQAGALHSAQIFAGYADITFFNEPSRYKQLHDMQA